VAALGTPAPVGPKVPAGSFWRFDVVAGLTAAAVVLPKAMAYAAVAGLPVAVGLYTAFIPMIVYALLGTSRVLSVSSTTTLAILAGTELALVVPDGDPARLVTATATLTALVGVMLVVARLMRLGFVADFISAPVLTGFKAGIGLVIVLDQVPKLLGIPHHQARLLSRPAQRRAAPPPDLLADARRGRRDARHPGGDGAPLAPLAGAAGGRRGRDRGGMVARPRSARRLDRGPHSAGTRLDHRCPTSRSAVKLLPAAAGIALMSFTETIAAGRAFAGPEDPPVDANRELVAVGASNLAGALSGAMPAGGGTSQTAVVRAAGGRTQRASLITAGAALATMLFLAPLLGLLPNATLAMIVIVYSIGLIQPAEFIAIRKVRTMEFRWAVAAALGVLLFGTLQGILVAIIVSLISLSTQATRPMVHVIGRKRGADVLRPVSPEHADDETFEGLLILRPEGRLFFANVQNVADQVKALTLEYQPRVLALDFSRVPDMEYSALQMLIESEKRTTEQGVVLWLAALNPSVLEVVRRAGFDKQLGKERLMFNARMVIERYQALRAAEDQGAAGAT
jgi:MFS superfamily sulfate permease-like transporter